MSTAHDTHGETHGGASHGSLSTYVTGLMLAVLLTIVPFMLVMTGAFGPGTLLFICFLFAAVQVFVHLRYFLHMDASSSQSWNLASLIFTLLVLFILIIGSLWVMHNSNVNMMPSMMPPSAETEMPNGEHGMHNMPGMEGRPNIPGTMQAPDGQPQPPARH